MEKIVCTICKLEKNRDEFPADRLKINGKRSNCYDCKNLRLRESRKNKFGNREWVQKTNEYQRNYLKNNPDKAKKYYKTKTKEDHLRYTLKANYGITLERYDEMLIEQCGVCKICGHFDIRMRKDGVSTIQRLAVDHCHKSGKVRGLLCSGCNGGLGLFRDDVDIIERALSYLKSQNNI